ncbi:unnamed protein product [Aphanomyces euteiches]
MTSTTSAAAAAALLPSRFLRSLNSWKAPAMASRRTSISPKYSYEEVRRDDEDPAVDDTLTCRLVSPAPQPQAVDAGERGFYDVLLQKDAHGLGICLAMDDRTHGSVVVTSFRRLHAGDIGPAEASERIRLGDCLVAVNGEPVQSLPSVYSKLSTTDATSFVMLRFFRGVAQESPVAPPSSPSPPSSHTRPLTQREVQMAMALQELTEKNKVLLHEMTEANMKVASQAAEIEALQAQLLQMRLDRDMQASYVRGWTHGMSRQQPVKAKQELDMVVTEATNELKRTALQLLEGEKQALRQETSQLMDKWKVDMLKKQRMLEEAILFMVDHVDSLESQPKVSPVDLEPDAKVAEIRAILDKYYSARTAQASQEPAPATSPVA